MRRFIADGCFCRPATAPYGSLYTNLEYILAYPVVYCNDEYPPCHWQSGKIFRPLEYVSDIKADCYFQRFLLSIDFRVRFVSLSESRHRKSLSHRPIGPSPERQPRRPTSRRTRGREKWPPCGPVRGLRRWGRPRGERYPEGPRSRPEAPDERSPKVFSTHADCSDHGVKNALHEVGNNSCRALLYYETTSLSRCIRIEQCFEDKGKEKCDLQSTSITPPFIDNFPYPGPCVHIVPVEHDKVSLLTVQKSGLNTQDTCGRLHVP